MNTSSYTIGFSNLTEKLSFAVDVRKSLEAAAAQYPNVNLVVLNNEQDSERARANVEEFAEIPVDIALIYHIDERAGLELIQVLQQKRIPIISVEIAIPLTTFFGIDNQEAGFLSGDALGKWITQNWNGEVDKVLVLADYRLTGKIRRRLDFALQALETHLGHKPEVFTIHSGNIRETAMENSLPVLKNWSDKQHIALIGMNDDTTLGAIDAARTLGIENNVVGVGHGATEVALDALADPESRLIASINMYPERYGSPLLELALRILNGEKVPHENLLRPTCLAINGLTI